MSDTTDDVDWFDDSLINKRQTRRTVMSNYHADAVGPVKTGQRGEYFSVKCANVWFFVEGGEDQRQAIQGRNFNGTARPSKNPKFNAWLSVVAIEEDKPKAPEPADDAPTATARPSNGGIPVNEWMLAMREFHKLAAELEPDELSKELVEGEAVPIELVKTDRSTARAAILNTCMIALSNNRIDMTDDVLPF